MNNEIWKPIKGYEGLYEISDRGRVKRVRRKTKNGCTLMDRILNPRKQKNGYLSLALTKNSKIKSVLIHRLVAEHFVPNPENKPEVNHKDFDRTNNNAENLEWCTHAENITFSREAGRYKVYKRKIIQYDSDKNKIKEWDSIKEAADSLGKGTTLIGKCCRGQRKSAYGYFWTYL